MFERFFQKKSDPGYVDVNKPRILERVEYPADVELVEIVRALSRERLSGVQVNFAEHELVYPAEFRAKIDHLLRNLDRN